MCVSVLRVFFFFKKKKIPFSVRYTSLTYALFCMYVVSTVRSYCCFIPVPVLLWSILCYPSFVINCAWFVHIMLMVDCHNDSYLKLCVILCSLEIGLLLNNHHFGSPASFNTSVLLMILFDTDLTHCERPRPRPVFMMCWAKPTWMGGVLLLPLKMEVRLVIFFPLD